MSKTHLMVEKFLEKTAFENIPIIPLQPLDFTDIDLCSNEYFFYHSVHNIDRLFWVVHTYAVENSISFSIAREQYGSITLEFYGRSAEESISLKVLNHIRVNLPDKFLPVFMTHEVLDSFITKNVQDSYRFPSDVEALCYLLGVYSSQKPFRPNLSEKQMDYYQKALKHQGSKYSEWFAALQSNKDEIDTILAFIRDELHMIAFKKSIDPIKLMCVNVEHNLKMYFKTLRTKIHLLPQMIPVIGPDGVGKTTLIKQVIQSSTTPIDVFTFKKTFRISPLYKLGIFFLRYALRSELKQDEFPGKSEVDDRYGNFVIFNALLLYPLRMLKYMLNRKNVFVDRYFHEYLLMNSRCHSEKVKLREDWKLLLKLIPKHRILIHLDAPNDVILSRKIELTDNGIKAYRHSLFQVFCERPFDLYAYVSTDVPVEQSSQLVLSIISPK